MREMVDTSGPASGARLFGRASLLMFVASKRLQWLLLPALIFLVAFYLYPLVKLFWTSIDGSSFSLRHYFRFLQDSVYTYVLARTLIVSVVVTLSCIILGLPVAFLLSRTRGGLRSILLLAVLIPYLTSFLVRSYAWIVVLDENGIINSVFLSTGLIKLPLKLVYNWIGVYVGMVQIMLPFMILPLYNNMIAIDARIDRAARSMGAGPLRRFFLIFLPLCAPGVKSGSLLVFLLSLGFYVTPAILGGLSDVTLSMLIETQVTQLVNWGFAGAAAMILLIATFGSYLIFGRGTGLDALFIGHQNQQTRHGKPIESTQPDRPRSVLSRCLLSFIGLLDRTFVARLIRPAAFASAALVLLTLILPSILVAIISFNSGDVLRFPPPGYSMRWFLNYFNNASWIEATILSVRLAVATSIVSTLLGVAAAFALSRGRGLLRSVSLGVILSPLIVPPIVLGVALYQPFAQLGLIGTETAVVIGHVIGALPYVFIIVSAGLQNVDPSYGRAAQSMGSGAFRTFWKITFPIIRPSVLVGALFAFIHSFDDLVIAMMVGGIRIETLPLKMWSDIRNSIDPTIAAVSTILILVVLVWVAILSTINRSRAFRVAN